MTFTLAWLRPYPGDVADPDLPGAIRARIEAIAAHEQCRRIWP